MKLQPTLVFKDELTKINKAYWLSRYSYTRISKMLGIIAKTGFSDPDPRVDSIWPTKDDGEAKQITCRVSSFEQYRRNIVAELRLGSVLRASSAFENALAGMPQSFPGHLISTLRSPDAQVRTRPLLGQAQT